AACRRSVDLPMPGSPPISVTEPATRPPPKTRSSSPMPVSTRGSSAPLTSASVFAPTDPGASAARAVAAAGFVTVTGVSEFHALHCGHCPCHLRLSLPHSSQRKIARALAMLVSLRDSLTSKARSLTQTAPELSHEHRLYSRPVERPGIQVA